MNKYFPKKVIHMAKRNPPALIIREMLIDSKVKNSLWKWLLKSRQEITSASEGLVKREYLFTVAGNAIQSSNYEKQYRISTHTHKNRTIIWSNNSTPTYLSKQNKNSNWKRYMHPYVNFSIIYYNQDMEKPKCQSLEEGIKKMKYIYKEILLDIKNKILIFVITDLNGIMLS